MAAPACNRHSDALSRIKELLTTEQAAGNLRRYLSSYGGAQFDRLIDRLVVNEFTCRFQRRFTSWASACCTPPASGSLAKAEFRCSGYWTTSPRISISGGSGPRTPDMV